MSTSILPATVLGKPVEPLGPDNMIYSTVYPYCLDCVVQVSVVIAYPGLTQPLRVALQLSPDGGTTWYTARMEPSRQSAATWLEPFFLWEYLRLNAWTNFRLRIGGNRGAPVTVSAIADGVCLGGGQSEQYTAPAFTGFVIAGTTSPVEIGTTINGTQTFIWSTSESQNVMANSIVLADTFTGQLASGLANSGSASIAVPTTTFSSPGTDVYTITGTDTESATFSETFTLSWEWRVYAGTSSSVELSASQIKALTDSANLQTAFAGTYQLSTLNYKFLCYPDSLGSVSTFIDGNTGFPISMATSTDDAAYSNTANGWSYALVSVTNVNGVTTNYRVYRSQYQLTSATKMVVT